MSECNHDCEHCAHKCSSAQTPESFLVDQNEFSDVRHVIGVVSGKGGSTLGLRYTEMIADLVKVVQDQEKRIAELEKNLKEME